MKFKVGDKVRVTDDEIDLEDAFAIVKEIDEDEPSGFFYGVCVVGFDEVDWVKEEALNPR